MFCCACGHENSPNARFCGRCGAQQAPETAPAEIPSPTTNIGAQGMRVQKPTRADAKRIADRIAIFVADVEPIIEASLDKITEVGEHQLTARQYIIISFQRIAQLLSGAD